MADMGWFVFMVVVWVLGLVLVPVRLWKKLWLAGMMGMLVVLAIDSTLIKLGAFKSIHSGISVLGLPIPYWAGYFPGGMLFAYYRPVGRWHVLGYIAGTAFVLWLMEAIMIRLGFFQHINWDLFKAYILNVGGFIILFSLFDWAGIMRRQLDEV